MRSAICIGLCMLVLIQISHAVLQLSSNAVNWHQAQVECRRQGLRLAVIDSLAKQTELTAFITKNSKYTHQECTFRVVFTRNATNYKLNMLY